MTVKQGAQSVPVSVLMSQNWSGRLPFFATFVCSIRWRAIAVVITIVARPFATQSTCWISVIFTGWWCYDRWMTGMRYEFVKWNVIFVIDFLLGDVQALTFNVFSTNSSPHITPQKSCSKSATTYPLRKLSLNTFGPCFNASIAVAALTSSMLSAPQSLAIRSLLL